MLSANGSPLVNGAPPGANMPKTVSVEVLRPFLIKAVRQEAGKVIHDMDWITASELISTNKARVVKAEPKPPEPAKPAKKEKANAGE